MDDLTKSKLMQVTENAMYKFWELVAADLPQIKTGDLDPQTSYKFERQCRDVIIEWIETNRKDV